MPRPPADAVLPSAPDSFPVRSADLARMSRAATAMYEVIAAVDLGSNSFHMVVARYSHGQLVIIDRLREMVRLGAGIGEDGRLDKEAAARALACLRALRPAPARYPRAQRARGRHQRAARRASQAGISRAGARGAWVSDRNRLRHGRGAPDLLRRRPSIYQLRPADGW